MIVDDALSDLGPRPPGPVLRVAGRVFPGFRAVLSQAEPYAFAWARSNAAAGSGSGSGSGSRCSGPYWVALGDSMALGVGASAWDLGWVGQLSARLSAGGWAHRVLNLSASGEGIDDVAGRQLAALGTLMGRLGPAAFVAVVVGSGDVASPLRRRGLGGRFAAMLDRLPRQSVVMNLATQHVEGRRIDELLRAREAAGSVVRADLRGDGPQSWRGLLAGDGFHPNDRGYAAMADVLVRALDRAGLPADRADPADPADP